MAPQEESDYGTKDKTDGMEAVEEPRLASDDDAEPSSQTPTVILSQSVASTFPEGETIRRRLRKRPTRGNEEKSSLKSEVLFV